MTRRMLPEWTEQWGVMLTWPHKGTDWAEWLDDVERGGRGAQKVPGNRGRRGGPSVPLRGVGRVRMLGPMTASPRRSRPIETCRFCTGTLLTSVFDTVFRDPEAEERLFFAIPGALCVPCRQLYVDQQLIGILGLDGARCTFAIESDRVLQAGQAGAA